ncbi:MAG: DMT family transporter [Ignavibacteriae bacterium]|nr:DMT family transporter [Ignavibacteriota bacterium]MCB9250659.1 DMT family transporter [Ignavibacteriales bacterium]
MNKLAPIFIIFAAMLWGIDGIVLRPELYSLPVGLVVLIESSIVAIYLSPILFKNIASLKSLESKDWLAFAGVALFGGAIGGMCITKALFYVNFVNLSIVILIQKLQPLFALGLAGIILKERLPRRFFNWAALAIFGTYLMTFGFKLPNISTDNKNLLAAMYAVIAAFSFGFSTVLSKRALQNVSFELGTYLRFGIASIIMILVVFSLGEFKEITSINNSQWFVFLIIAFTTGGPAIFIYYYGLKNITASSSTILELAFPLTAIILEYFLHDNILSFVQWIGVVILIYSITNVVKLSNKRRAELRNSKLKLGDI